MKKLIDVQTQSVLFFFLFFVINLQAQETWKEVKTISVGKARLISADSHFNIYIANESGIVSQYDSLGDKIAFFSPGKKSKVTCLDGSRNVNVFLFYKNFQEYKLLNRFLTEISTTRLNHDQIGFVSLATLSPDNALWLLDESDLALKKLNSEFNQIIVNSSLLPILPRTKNEFIFTNLREYNNNLYLSDKSNGIFVFDNLGNFKTLIPASDIEHFSFWENNLYFIESSKLHIINLIRNERRIVEREFPRNAQIILSRNKAYILHEDKLSVHRHNIIQ